MLISICLYVLSALFMYFLMYCLNVGSENDWSFLRVMSACLLCFTGTVFACMALIFRHTNERGFTSLAVVLIAFSSIVVGGLVFAYFDHRKDKSKNSI